MHNLDMQELDSMIAELDGYLEKLSDAQFFEFVDKLGLVLEHHVPREAKEVSDPEEEALLYDGELFEAFLRGYNGDNEPEM